MENLVLDQVAKKGRLDLPGQTGHCRACRNSPQGAVPQARVQRIRVWG